ncbi:STAS domain-containing protein [Mycobacterium syngnathidarum]
MSTMNAAKPAAPTPNKRIRAGFSTQWLSSATPVITVHGELDASNAADLVECGLQHSRPGRQLVLDLSAVEFFGAGCFACLHTLNVRYIGDDVDWVLIPSSAVSRVLRICDPACALPIASELPAALSMLRDQPRQLQLVNAHR